MRVPLLCSVAVILLLVDLLAARSPQVLKLLDTVTMDEIEGPVQHLAVDIKGQRIFLAAASHNTVEVFGAQKLKRLSTISGLADPQDLVFLPASNRLLVSNGADGSLRTYDGTTLKLIDSKPLGGDADRIGIGPGGKSVLVGWGVGGMAIVDMQSGKRTDIRLQSHPESFQLAFGGSRIFVNLPGLQQIAVIDRRSETISALWSVHPYRGNELMALDEESRRIFVVCRKPAKLLVFNMEDGDLVTSMSTVADAGDVFFDRERKRIYVVGGEGELAVYRQKSADEYSSMGRVDTVPGARTGLFVPEWNRLYVAARDNPPNSPAEMLSFAVME